MEKKMRVIIFKDGDKWVAQALEHDICVTAEDMDDLIERLHVAVRLEGSEPGGLDRIGEAPRHFHELWEKKALKVMPEHGLQDNFDFAMAA